MTAAEILGELMQGYDQRVRYRYFELLDAHPDFASEALHAMAEEDEQTEMLGAFLERLGI